MPIFCNFSPQIKKCKRNESIHNSTQDVQQGKDIPLFAWAVHNHALHRVNGHFSPGFSRPLNYRYTEYAGTLHFALQYRF